MPSHRGRMTTGCCARSHALIEAGDRGGQGGVMLTPTFSCTSIRTGRAGTHGIFTAASSSTGAGGPTAHGPMSPSACIGKAMLSVCQRNLKMPFDRARARKEHVKYQLNECPCCPDGLCNRDNLSHVDSAICPDVPDVLVVFGHVVCPTDDMASHA